MCYLTEAGVYDETLISQILMCRSEAITCFFQSF